ncbi:hypothetical protein [Zymobacter sp. IVIA_5232.4 C2]|uniref:hypothetical protein n=1 Tax=Zymobacter sp. IVIA_5232.4 C2 TaxID=3394855 RepID=UPI0039C1D608
MQLAFIWPILLKILLELVVVTIVLTRLVPARKGLSWTVLVAISAALISDVAEFITITLVSYGSYESHRFIILYMINGIIFMAAQVIFWVLLAVFIYQVVKALTHKGKAVSASEALAEEPSVKSGRGSLILTFGILGLLMFWPLGLAAWIMGASDLGKAHSGVTFSDKNMVKTRYGMTLGIIATLLPVIFILAVFGIALLR